MSKYNLVYMAKPGYGGWVSFTAHLSLKYNYDLFKVTKRNEKNKRNYGYGVQYLNQDIDTIVKLPNLIITAIDKNYYQYLEKFPDGTCLIIHDPTEVKGKSTQAVIDNLKRFNIITIRKTVQTHLKETFNVDSKFIHHPFYAYSLEDHKVSKKEGAVSISRIDYDKNTDIILRTNANLENKIPIYGCKNDLYVYRKLLVLDSMDEKDSESCYKGRFDKSFTAVSEILKNHKFMIDLSSIYKDGGGSQYTFLEAIYNNCILVLNKKWVDGLDTPFKNGINCFVVKDDHELLELIKNNPDVDKMLPESYKLLEPHLNCNWVNL